MNPFQQDRHDRTSLTQEKALGMTAMAMGHARSVSGVRRKDQQIWVSVTIWNGFRASPHAVPYAISKNSFLN